MTSAYKKSFDKGMEFRAFIKNLMQDSGYIEGQLYSTSGKFSSDYPKELSRLGKPSYVSADITVLNKWEESGPELDERFGIVCERRDAKFENKSKQSVLIPTYQRINFERIHKEKGLPLYLVFGRTVGKTFAVGVTELRKPDDVRANLPNVTTGTPRKQDVFYIDTLQSWTQFIDERIKADDPEPELSKVKKLNVLKLQ
jgi:hypothetical protein